MGAHESARHLRAIMLCMPEGLNDISGLLVQFAILILGLAVLWFVARLVLRLTVRIFTAGCIIIVVVGICIFAFRVTS